MDEIIEDFEKGKKGGNGSNEESVKEEIQELKRFARGNMALDEIRRRMRAHRSKLERIMNS